MGDKRKNVLILGFFDGIHLGHREVIRKAVGFSNSNNAKTILLTFSNSPAEYFQKRFEYIYPRKYNYELVKDLGVCDIKVSDFDEIVTIEAESYIQKIIKQYSPVAIFTGYNYTFGYKRLGNTCTLNKYQEKYNYKYFCIPEIQKNGQTVSSTNIKKLLKMGDIINANQFLGQNFKIESTVVKGSQIARKMDFPTANLNYPEKITKLPYGVYKTIVNSRPAVLNWGVKPTFGINKEVLEVHIPNFSGNLYNKNLKIEFLRKIRDEKKFKSIEELKTQIKKDTEECLKS